MVKIPVGTEVNFLTLLSTLKVVVSSISFYLEFFIASVNICWRFLREEWDILLGLFILLQNQPSVSDQDWQLPELEKKMKIRPTRVESPPWNQSRFFAKPWQSTIAFSSGHQIPAATMLQQSKSQPKIAAAATTLPIWWSSCGGVAYKHPMP